MVTRGFHKRACAVVLVNKVKNPIKLAREMLVRGGKDGLDGDGLSRDAGGAQGHCCLGGKTVEKLAKDWGLDMVDESYFWTRKRWDEHKRGLRESGDERTFRQSRDVWPNITDSFDICVGLAILENPHAQATVSEIIEWLSKKTPWRDEPQHIWQDRVSAVLDRGSQLSPYQDPYFGTGRRFVQLQRPDNEARANEPFWIVARDQVSNFLKARDEGYRVHNKSEEQKEGKCRRPLFPEQDSRWDGQAYLPQGTVGCVALDRYGSMSVGTLCMTLPYPFPLIYHSCVATSTGGLTNKLSGRVSWHFQASVPLLPNPAPIMIMRHVSRVS